MRVYRSTDSFGSYYRTLSVCYRSHTWSGSIPSGPRSGVYRRSQSDDARASGNYARLNRNIWS